MTNFDFNVKIDCKKIPSFGEMYKNMGEYTGVLNIRLPLLCKIQQSCEMGFKMNELHTNLREAANYLIECFNATGQAYSCSRTKIGKLLSIVAFLYAQRDILLFDEAIYKYDGCGTTIEELKSFIDRDVYIKFFYADNKQPINMASAKVHLEGLTEINLSPEIKRDIEAVFSKFGSFIPFDLGKCINPIVKHISLPSEESLNLSKIQNLNIETFKDIDENRELIEFLYAPLEISDAE